MHGKADDQVRGQPAGVSGGAGASGLALAEIAQPRYRPRSEIQALRAGSSRNPHVGHLARWLLVEIREKEALGVAGHLLQSIPPLAVYLIVGLTIMVESLGIRCQARSRW